MLKIFSVKSARQNSSFGTSESKCGDQSEQKPREDSPMIQTEAKTEKSDIEKNSCLSKFGHRVFFIQWAFMLASSILAYFYIGDFVQGIVNKSLVIDPSSDFYYLWKEPPVSPEMKIYLFSILNSEAWLGGTDSKLKVQQVGPFVYKENWVKNNITFHSRDQTVSYRTLKKFTFVPGKSADENMLVTVANIPLFAAAASMKNADFWTVMGFKTALSVMEAQAKQIFLTKSAKDIIWGYDDQLSSVASLVLPQDEIASPGKFGLMAGKNGSLGDWFKVNTGEQSLSKISQIVKYKGQSHFKAWGTEICNQIKGSDGGYYPPWIHQRDILSLFVPELCSSIQLASDGEEIMFEPANIKTLRFKPHSSMFNYALKQNHCFCSTGSSPSESTPEEEEEEPESEPWTSSLFNWFGSDQSDNQEIDAKVSKAVGANLSCPPKGLMDINLCKFEAPLSLSWPHFYKADKTTWDAVEGLDIPNDNDHGFRIDIQPVMGLAISANIRMQMNLQLENSKILPTIPLEAGEKLYLPVMWFDNVISQPPADLMLMISEALQAGESTAKKVLIFSAIFLSGQLCVYTIFLLWKKPSKRKTSNATFVTDNVLPSTECFVPSKL